MRVKISEYRSKKLIYKKLGYEYKGLSIDLNSDLYKQVLEKRLSTNKSYVVKVDQAIKKRNKLGLVFVDISNSQVEEKLNKIKKMGYRWALIEPYIKHNLNEERYISIEINSDGLKILYSENGGAEVEAGKDNVSTYNIRSGEKIKKDIQHSHYLEKLVELYNEAHFTNLEINPFIIQDDKFMALDAAVQVDGAAQFLVDRIWNQDDFRESKTSSHSTELEVEKLASKSSASLNLKVLNENGSIFMLLSGGGASVVISDELSQAGLQEDVANYGEYSGNPNEEDTYLYAKQVINLLINSKKDKKVLIIAGGVANFTDVSTTFKGIIRAINDNKQKIVKQKIVVVVRRGGPNEDKGLSMISDYFKLNDIKSIVLGSDYSLADITQYVKEGLNI